MFVYQLVKSISFLRTYFFLLLITVINCSAISLLFTQTALAQGGAAVDEATSSGDDWSFRLAPYVWVPMMKGDVGIRNITADIDTSMSDIIDNLDGGALIAFEARYRRWSSTTDFIWLGLEDDQPTPRGVLFSSAKAEIDQIAWTQMLGYQVSECDDMPIDLLAGFRLVSLSTDLTLREGLSPAQKFSADDDWIDPVIGARTLININDPVYLRLYADIGGFDVSSSLTWQALGAIDWNITNSTAFSVGYRALGYDYSRSNFSYDVISHGPIIGLNLKF